MTRWYLYLFCAVFVLAGCSEEGAAPSQPAQTAVKPPPAKQVAPPVAQEDIKKEEKPEFSYVVKGRRDPFVPLTSIRRPIQAQEIKEPETPLQSYDLPQFRLIGLIVGRGEPKAMVVAPDGKSYLLSKGLKIGKNNGVILDITSESIVVEEKYYDFSGNVIENIQEISVPTR